MCKSLPEQFDARLQSRPLISTAELTNAGLMVGAQTNLSRRDDHSNTDQERLKALPTIVYRGSISKSAINHVYEAVLLWDRDDKALAQIRLAFARLPRLDDVEDAYRLFLADLALAKGIEPGRLIAELLPSIAPQSFDKFDPNQDRVPAGQSTGGQWTPGRTFILGPTETTKPSSKETVTPPSRSKPDKTAGTLVVAANAGLEARCEAQYERDIFQCRMVGLRACYAQAAQRYAACLSGAQIPPFNY
jgi:hypothetical protein